MPGYDKIDLIILPETAINFNIKRLNENEHKNNFGLDYIKNIIIGALKVLYLREYVMILFLMETN